MNAHIHMRHGEGVHCNGAAPANWRRSFLVGEIDCQTCLVLYGKHLGHLKQAVVQRLEDLTGFNGPEEARRISERHPL